MSARKPFVDRSVNETPFQKNKIYPVKQEPIQITKTKTPQKKYPDWLLDICSYKEVFDDCWDLNHAPNEALRDGLSSYFQARTPPPLFRNVETFFEIPAANTLPYNDNGNYCRLEEIDEEPDAPLIDIGF